MTFIATEGFEVILGIWHYWAVLKITSGTHRGRRFKALDGLDTRPTQERVRQAWLNSLQFQLKDARVLDLFSGSGALGFEALSRGAASVVMVEKNPKAIQIIEENIATLDFSDQVQLFKSSAETAYSKVLPLGPYQLVFMDPPYRQGLEDQILANWDWSQILSPGGKICVETATPSKNSPPKNLSTAISALRVVRDESYGDTQLIFFEKGVPS